MQTYFADAQQYMRSIERQIYAKTESYANVSGKMVPESPLDEPDTTPVVNAVRLHRFKTGIGGYS